MPKLLALQATQFPWKGRFNRLLGHSLVDGDEEWPLYPQTGFYINTHEL